MVEGSSLEVIRTPASLADLTRTAAQDGVVFAGAVGGGYVFPQFIPAYDAVASLCNLLELLAPLDRPLSELVAELPAPTLVHRQITVPVGAQGLRHARGHRAAEDRDVDLTDGIKVFDERGWAQVLADPDEPIVHVYAEGRNAGESAELEGELRSLIEEVLQEETRAGAANTLNLKLTLSVPAASIQTRTEPQPKGPRGLVPRSRHTLRPGAEGPDPRPRHRRRTRSRTAAASCTGTSTSSARSSSRACARASTRGRARSARRTSSRLTEILAAKGVAACRSGTSIEPRLLPGVRVPEPGLRELLRALRHPARQGRGAVRRRRRRTPSRSVRRGGRRAAELGVEGPALVVRSGGGRAGEHFLPAGRARRSAARRTATSSSTTSPSHAATPCSSTRTARFSIEDQGSLNGTFVNRARIDTAALEDGDEVQIGKYRLTFFAR